MHYLTSAECNDKDFADLILFAFSRNYLLSTFYTLNVCQNDKFVDTKLGVMEKHHKEQQKALSLHSVTFELQICKIWTEQMLQWFIIEFVYQKKRQFEKNTFEKSNYENSNKYRYAPRKRRCSDSENMPPNVLCSLELPSPIYDPPPPGSAGPDDAQVHGLGAEWQNHLAFVSWPQQSCHCPLPPECICL